MPARTGWDALGGKALLAGGLQLGDRSCGGVHLAGAGRGAVVSAGGRTRKFWSSFGAAMLATGPSRDAHLLYQVAFNPAEFAWLVPWLMLNRGPLDVLVYPGRGTTSPTTGTTPLGSGRAAAVAARSPWRG